MYFHRFPLFSRTLLLAGAILLPQASFAAIRVWDGGGADDNWNTSANWSDNVMPGNGDIVLFDATSTDDSTINSTFTGSIAGLRAGPGYTGTITLGKNLTISGSLIMTGGTFDVSSSNYSLTVSGDWQLNGDADFVPRSGNIILTGTGTNYSLTHADNFNNLTLDSGLIGYWKMDDGTGSTTVRDSSRYGNHGTLVEGDSGTQWLGAPNHAARFYNPGALDVHAASGVTIDSGHVDIGTTDLYNFERTEKFSFAFWIKLQYPSTGTSNNVVFARESSDGTYRGYQLVMGKSSGTPARNNGISLALVNTVTGGNYFYSTTNRVIADGDTSWHHVVAAYNGNSSVSGVTYYFDGVGPVAHNDAANNLSATTRGSSSLYLGSDSSHTPGYCRCSLDDMRIYKRFLGRSEAIALASGYLSTGSGVYTLGSSLDVDGTFSNYGTLDISGSNYALTMGGNWTNHGVLVPRSGTVTFDGSAAQTLSGSVIFHNLTVSGSTARTLFFDYIGRQSVSGALILRGSEDALLSLRSTKSSSQSHLLLDADTGTQTIAYLSVKDSNASDGLELICYTDTEGCVDAGNNTHWSIVNEISSSSAAAQDTSTASTRSQSGGGGRGGNAYRAAQIADAQERLHTYASSSQRSEYSAASASAFLRLPVDGESITYRDVPHDAWFTPYVSLLIEAGIAQGYRDIDGNLTGEFGAASPVTFAEMLKMTFGAAGIEVPPVDSESPRFTWATSYVKLAGHIVDEDVDVHAPATRGEVFDVMLKILEKEIDSSAPSTFTDLPANHPYAAAINTAVQLGWISGDTDAEGNLLYTVRPDDVINRAEIAKILSGLLD